MFKKTIMSIAILILSNTIHAETCQTPADLKAGLFNEWQAMDYFTGTPASEQQIAHLKKHVKNFEQAKWKNKAPEGAAQCFYSGNWGTFDVYFTKSHVVPKEVSAWNHYGKNMAECNSSLDACEFVAG